MAQTAIEWIHRRLSDGREWNEMPPEVVMAASERATV